MKWLTVDGSKVIAVSRMECLGGIEVPDNTLVDIGMDVREYDENWQLRPLSERVADGIIEVPRGKKLIGEKFVPMTQFERYRSGVDPVPAGIILESDRFRLMTLEEQVSSGLIAHDQADQILEISKRKIRKALFLEHDAAILQLTRKIRYAERTGQDTGILNEKLAEFDAWADALCDLPEQPGWPNINMPRQPEMPGGIQ